MILWRVFHKEQIWKKISNKSEDILFDNKGPLYESFELF